MKIRSYSEKKNIQSICESNRTQGVIEEPFYQLKHVYLDNIRSSRIDKFIVKYEKEIATSCSLFGENLLHHGYIKRKVSTTPKSRKEESKALLKVDFKKRKRRYSGYFTSKQAAKKLKYVSSSIDESQNNRPSLKSDIRNQQPDIINREEEQQERTFVSLGKRRKPPEQWELEMCDFATCREITSHFEHSQKNLADQVVTFIAEMAPKPQNPSNLKLT